jgi:soluble lytic murein transglycosylase-like protein
MQYGLDETRFRRIAWCESRLNPRAVSPGGHKGVFQFADRTWRWASAAAGYPGASPFDAEANIYSAAWLMSQPGGFAHWECR